MDQQSTTYWLDQLRDGQRTVAEHEIWNRYFHRLAALAKKRLRSVPRRAEDEEDVALSALGSFFDGARAGRFPEIDDRDNLWLILSTITIRKAINQGKRQIAEKRGGGKVRGESVLLPDEDPRGLANMVGGEPTPQDVVELCEFVDNLLGGLADDTLRTIARMKIQGFTNAEIAKEIGKVERTVERKLDRIRKTWLQYLDSEENG